MRVHWKANDSVGLGAMAGLAVMLALSIVIVFSWLTRLPLPDEALAVAPTGSVVAFDANGPKPTVLVRENGTLVLVDLRLNWSPLLRSHVPQWQLSRARVVIQPTNDPASLTLIGCDVGSRPCRQSVKVVGEVIDARISQLQLLVNGRVETFLVQPPAYITSFPSNVCFDNVRWRDSNGRLIFSMDLVDKETYDDCLDAR